MVNYARTRVPEPNYAIGQSDDIQSDVYSASFGDALESFRSRRGLRQGDGLSCLLFNIAMETVVRREGIDTSGTIFRKSGQLLGFADNIDIMARNFETLTEMYSRLKAEANRLNTSKTKKGNSVSLPPRVLIDGDEVEMTDEFVYLGSLEDCRSNKCFVDGQLCGTCHCRRYNHATWTLLVKDQCALGFFERKVLCMIATCTVNRPNGRKSPQPTQSA
ncbi:uncharacterized protein LOC129724889 [Wyeomyia smithii]|uniref:uncharacterized protein LOC129724889 n=1 Tax=Wyeomyia smithii TaxID=174621 RepID=UPI002467D064|nr:uncharacterized protein LOC129724889 [Wyeomyia smithii]